MPQQCLAIQDTVTGLWLVSWDPINHTGQFGNSRNAVCFTDEESRSSVLAYLNLNDPNRYVGAVPPPPK